MRNSIFSKVFFQGVSSEVSIFKWLKLTLLESYLGEQVIDIILSVSSYQARTVTWTGGDTAQGGYRGELEYFIPATSINKLLKKHILELLEIKYCKHYQVLVKSQAKRQKTLYSANPQNLPVLSELKLSYNTIWVFLNVVIDVIVYLVTADISAALLSGAVIEFIRRFKI